ncbi:hypothetical protein ACH5RR_028104 [Cinchona calisaya]|uniref:Uncharacterized protein n=1 Tax=Cinchona calisaya TaxID=153742 RepID=A0ABD2YP05_9GENT
MGSSSKRKSSRKKSSKLSDQKSSKLSTQARKMKKSRTKSKKLGRRHDSRTDDSTSSQSISSPGNDSYFSNSDDDSLSSASISTSSTEDTYRRRKNVSRSRGNLKKTRKRARKRSSKRESSEELPCMKKRKRPKKNSDSKSRKKSQRKKPRRYASISSASSDTHSCSTCKGGSNREGEERGCERIRSRSRENKKDKRDSRMDKLGNKISSHRSRSHSSYSRSRDRSGSVSHSEAKLLSESNSRRLRSVITFPEYPSDEEGNKWENDLQKEEIVHDHEDYPSRSSSGGGSKKESTPHSPIAFDDEKWTQNVKFVSNSGNDEPSESGNDTREPYVRDPFVNEAETNNSIEESRKDFPLPEAGSGGDDLEAILRQKALQNLKKFQGGLKNKVEPTANQKNKDEGVVNLSSTSKAEFVQGRLPEQASLKEVEREVSDEGYTGKVSGIAKQDSNHPPHGLEFSGNPKKEGHTARNPVVGTSVTRNTTFSGRSTGMDSTLNQSKTSVASPDKNLIETKKSETELKVVQSASPNSNRGMASSSATAEPASCATSERQSFNNQLDDAKDGSQYQQKTMSVMRGGEMVQVNYKVYIPKRAPALTRRQLKR